MATSRTAERPRRRNRGAVATGARLTVARRRQESAYQGFMQGLSLQEIADLPDTEDKTKPLYASRSSAKKAVAAAMDRHCGARRTQDMIDQHDRRYEQLLAALWPQCMDPRNKSQHWAIDRAVTILEKRELLHGVRAPVKKVVEVITDDATERAIDKLERELAGRGDPGDLLDDDDEALEGLTGGAP